MESGFLHEDVKNKDLWIEVVSILVLMESGFLQVEKLFLSGGKEKFLSLF